jgi:hypothetical protein
MFNIDQQSDEAQTVISDDLLASLTAIHEGVTLAVRALFPKAQPFPKVFAMSQIAEAHREGMRVIEPVTGDFTDQSAFQTAALAAATDLMTRVVISVTRGEHEIAVRKSARKKEAQPTDFLAPEGSRVFSKIG